FFHWRGFGPWNRADQRSALPRKCSSRDGHEAHGHSCWLFPRERREFAWCCAACRNLPELRAVRRLSYAADCHERHWDVGRDFASRRGSEERDRRFVRAVVFGAAGGGKTGCGPREGTKRRRYSAI